MRKKKWYNIVLTWEEWEKKEEIICKVRTKGLAYIIYNHLKNSVYKEPVYKLKIV